jgi:hypothetical protein
MKIEGFPLIDVEREVLGGKITFLGVDMLRSCTKMA